MPQLFYETSRDKSLVYVWTEAKPQRLALMQDGFEVLKTVWKAFGGKVYERGRSWYSSRMRFDEFFIALAGMVVAGFLLWLLISSEFVRIPI